jgi:[ribosomal protein S5]-alanine N-acetyltransferase
VIVASRASHLEALVYTLIVDKWFPIRTSRLLLRPFTEHDESDVHEYGSDAVVSQHADWGPNTAAQTHDRIEGYLEEQMRWPRDEVSLAVELRTERKVIGTVRLKIQDERTRTADLGFVFHRRYWNQGYATEATSAVLRVAFTTLGLHRVWATCDTRNVGSWRVMEKVGMRREAEFRRDAFQKGQWRDSYLYAMLEDDEAATAVS